MFHQGVQLRPRGEESVLLALIKLAQTSIGKPRMAGLTNPEESRSQQPKKKKKKKTKKPNLLDAAAPDFARGHCSHTPPSLSKVLTF